MLFITHHLAIVPYIAQRGEVDEIFSRRQYTYTQALLAAVPVPDPRVRAAA